MSLPSQHPREHSFPSRFKPWFNHNYIVRDGQLWIGSSIIWLQTRESTPAGDLLRGADSTD